ncbi:MAG: MBL fold metallo-hydrolase [Oscillospiraceae bacterium]|nr:MBL fold metallo-hydrolase [Oscillospiraceae bacterium]
MELIWHGTASMEAVCGQGRLLFDPFVPLKGSSVKTCIADYDGFSDIFVTHCHLDHVVDLPEIAERNPDTVIHCTQAAFDALRKKGVPEKNLSLLRYGDRRDVNGFAVRVFHGRHAVLPKLDARRVLSWIKSPARRNVPYMYRENRACRERDETVCYQLEAEGKSVFLLGSMNLRDEVTYPTGADVLVLPYAGWVDNLPPAVRVIERLQPKRVLLDHWDDTFPPLSSWVDTAPLVRRYPDLVTALTHGEPVRV